MDYAVVALVLKNGKVLGVSRKDNHSDMGLPGGKLEPNETFEEAVVRETKEETGLDVKVISYIFKRENNNFIGKTFYCELINPNQEIFTIETGRVDWIDWEELFEGSFGEYNKSLHEHITNIGLK